MEVMDKRIGHIHHARKVVHHKLCISAFLAIQFTLVDDLVFDLVDLLN